MYVGFFLLVCNIIFFFSSPDQKGLVRCSHFASVVVAVVCKLLRFQSISRKQLAQLEKKT